MITSATTLQYLFDIAIQALPDIDRDEPFIVRDLFRGFEWNRIAKGNRTKLGSMFYSYAQGAGANCVKPVKKTPQNQQIYIKL